MKKPVLSLFMVSFLSTNCFFSKGLCEKINSRAKSLAKVSNYQIVENLSKDNNLSYLDVFILLVKEKRVKFLEELSKNQQRELSLFSWVYNGKDGKKYGRIFYKPLPLCNDDSNVIIAYSSDKIIKDDFDLRDIYKDINKNKRKYRKDIKSSFITKKMLEGLYKKDYITPIDNLSIREQMQKRRYVHVYDPKTKQIIGTLYFNNNWIVFLSNGEPIPLEFSCGTYLPA